MFCGCSQRFFRALRLPDRREDVTLSEITVFVRKVRGEQRRQDSGKIVPVF